MPARLDAIDRKILKELQDDGRMTNVELARRVGISAPPCLRRVRALEEAGYIKGYRALLDEKMLGYEVTVFAMVHLASQAEADLDAFEEFVRAQPLVRECWMLSGEIDFVLEVRGAGFENLPGLRREAHRGAARAQREDLADAAQFERRGHGADGRLALTSAGAAFPVPAAARRFLAALGSVRATTAMQGSVLAHIVGQMRHIGRDVHEVARPRPTRLLLEPFADIRTAFAAEHVDRGLVRFVLVRFARVRPAAW